MKKVTEDSATTVNVTIKDPGWTEFVLSLMTEKEKYDGNPKVAGLRRMVETLIGPIINMGTDFTEQEIKRIYSKQGGSECTEIFYNTIAKHVFQVKLPDEKCTIVSFCGSADSSIRNTEANFSRFGTAIAETRAKGRAYINALGLQCVSSEELNDNPADKLDILKEKIKDTQISAIDVMCKRCNVNVKKFFGDCLSRYGASRVTALTDDDAKDIIKTLNSFQKDTSLVPSNLNGYSATWRDSMGVKDE